ncbi:hypothetical protein [Streptomyces sp. NPDC002156]
MPDHRELTISENREGMAAIVVSLTAEATELETRAAELRRELVDVDKRMEAISDALHRLR